MSQIFSDNINSFNVSNHFTTPDERPEILAWLSPLEPRVRHQDIRNRRIDNVGNWILRTQEYRRWCESCDGDREGESRNAALFCSGGPGVGKTYMSSLVIDNLCDQAKGKNVAVACFYFDFASQKEQPLTNMLGALLKQIVSGLDEIPNDIVQAFRDQRKVIGGRELRLEEALNMLQTLSSKQPMFICVDAIDECPVEYRLQLLVSLRQVLQSSSGTRILMTGRSHIQSEIEKHLGRRAVAIPISPRNVDISIFLDTKLGGDAIPEAMDSGLKAEIVKSILESGSETFLLVSLTIEAILREPTIHLRREKLKAMKGGLGLEGVYGATLERIKEQGGEKARLGMATLMWIFHSKRPLRIDELCHALAVEIGSTDINTDNVPSIKTLLDCCQGLVAVDGEASTVRLIHLTLQEYFYAHPDLFEGAHTVITETCLSYLNLQCIKDLPASRTPALGDAPLLEYSSIFWGNHARMELSDRAKSLAIELLDCYDNHISARYLFNEISKGGLLGYTLSRGAFTALHAISFFGIVEVVQVLLEREKTLDMNQQDNVGMTPLSWAARFGHEETVRLLLRQKHIDPDSPDAGYGRTALSWAAGNGHEGVVRLFLSRNFVNPEAIHRWQGKRSRAKKLLLGKKYVNPNSVDTLLGQTPLSWAAATGHEGAVKTLLERKDVDPNRPDNYHQTPLSWAAKMGHEGMVKLLLSREDVCRDIPESISLTPLWWAAENGHEELVRLLLKRKDVDPNGPDESGRTPLLWAVEKAHDGIVRSLLEREDIDPNKPDIFGQTPLLWAVQMGDEELAKMLLGQKGIDPNRQCSQRARLLVGRPIGRRPGQGRPLRK